MAQAQMTAKQLHPTNPELRQATIKAFEDQKEADAQAFLDKVASASAPAPIGAIVTLTLAVWGKLLVEPDGQPWKYNPTVWGTAGAVKSAGFMYTAYDSWDAFFQNVTSFHVQGISSGGGILQVNWFIGNGTPVGQFNGAAGGIGLIEAGGAGKWEHT